MPTVDCSVTDDDDDDDDDDDSVSLYLLLILGGRGSEIQSNLGSRT